MPAPFYVIWKRVVRKMRLFTGFLFALIIALFAVQNSAFVSIHFFTWSVETSLVLVIIGSAALGALSATLLRLPGSIRLALKVREYEGKIRKLEAEAKQLMEKGKAQDDRAAAVAQVDSKGVGQCGSGSETAGNT